jgi:CRP/FNR family transcriptional regulator/CRP/FNR family cyclic AMP-dependent transcriptional regulator
MVNLFKEVKLMQCFSNEELAEITKLGTMCNYEAYANIVIEGELTWGIYFIIDGMVGIFKTNKLSSNSYDVGHLKKGSFFGEMSLVDEDPRSATVRALTNCQLFFIPKEKFNAFLNASQPRKLKFFENCIQLIVSRLRELDDSYVISQYQLWKTALTKDKGAA